MMINTEVPVWRSLLYVPVNVDRFVNKAHERGADGIILDIEDSVPTGEKANTLGGKGRRGQKAPPGILRGRKALLAA